MEQLYSDYLLNISSNMDGLFIVIDGGLGQELLVASCKDPSVSMFLFLWQLGVTI